MPNKNAPRNRILGALLRLAPVGWSADNYSLAGLLGGLPWGLAEGSGANLHHMAGYVRNRMYIVHPSGLAIGSTPRGMLQALLGGCQFLARTKAPERILRHCKGCRHAFPKELPRVGAP